MNIAKCRLADSWWIDAAPKSFVESKIFTESLTFTDGIQPPKPVKGILKVEKNRDGKAGKTNLYFDNPRSRILTNDEYMDEFGEVMKI